MKRYRTLFVATMMYIAGSSLACAQGTIRFDQKYADSIKERTEIANLEADAFGDRINLVNGSVEFQWTDIDIPGNSGLPVRLQRSLVIEDKTRAVELGGFGDFGNLDIPYMRGVFSTAGWKVAGSQPDQRCSQYGPPPSFSEITFQDYWDGNSMHIPWVGDQILLKPNAGAVALPTGAAPIVTKDFWAFKCTPTTNGYPGEGFIAMSPSGEKYYFTHAITKAHSGLSKRYGNYAHSTATLDRVAVYLMLTRIEDRFGNSVTYSYANDRLSRIDADDGRFIAIDGWSGNRVTHVTSSVGAWSYSYPSQAMTVTRPDNSTWQYTMSGQLAVVPTPALPLYDGPDGPNGPNCPAPEISTGDYTLNVKHPSGATASFVFTVERHGKSNVPRLCNSFIDESLMSYRYLTIPNFSDSLTLVSKQINGPGLTSMTRQYDYLGGGGGLAFEDVCADPPTEFACPQTSWTEVRGSDGSFERYTFGNLYKINYGQLLKEEKGSVDAGGAITILQTTERVYISEQEAEAAAFPSQLGNIGNSRIDDIGSAKLRPVKSNRITRDQVGYEAQYSSFDKYARPQQVIRTGGL